MTSFVEVTHDGHVSTLTINRPDKLNALDGPTRQRFLDVMNELRHDDDVRVVVVTGAGAAPHPPRRRLAGRPAGSLFDRLQDAQNSLKHGQNGTDKPLSCSASLLAKIATTRPRDGEGMARILGEKRAERFGPAFLDVLAEAD